MRNKGWISTILILCIICSLNVRIPAYAAGNYEIESNNDISTANQIKLNGSINGNTKDYKDADYYIFEVEKSGYVEIKLNHSDLTNSNDGWNIYLYCSDDTKNSIHDAYMPVSKAESKTPRIGVEKGVYYIKIDGAYQNDVYGVEYSLTVNYKSSAYYESEYNGEFKTADKIELEKSYNGFIKNYNDADYYKLEVDKQGYIEIKLNNSKLTDSNDRWNVYLYRSDDTKNSIHDAYMSVSKAESKTPRIGVEKGVYYIKIDGAYQNDVYGVEYSLTVNYKSSAYYESEYNGEFKTADKIELEKSYNGFIKNYNDADYYKLEVDKQGYIEIKLNNSKLTDSNDRWNVYLYRSDDAKNSIHDADMPVSKEESKTPRIGVEKGVYYIKIDGAYQNDVYGVEYSLTVLSVDRENGDIDGNEKIDATDALLVLKYAARIANLDNNEMRTADVNGDGKVDATDALQILKYAAKIIDSF